VPLTLVGNDANAAGEPVIIQFAPHSAAQATAFPQKSLQGRRLRDQNDRDAIEWIGGRIGLGLWKYDPELAILKTSSCWRVKVYSDLRFDPVTF
jgi:hypothetical protein